jgi:hypothetical protein
MPRRTVLTPKEINLRRGNSWEFHYRQHVMVRGLGTSLDREKIARVIAREVPCPEMRIDGSLVEGMDVVQGVARAMEQLNFSYAYRDLICIWYWSQEGWDSFVHDFQSLPEVSESYYLFYDADADAVLILPMSSKEKRVSGTSQVHLSTTARLVPGNAVEV